MKKACPYIALLVISFLLSCTVKKSAVNGSSSLQKKYSSLLGVSEKEISDIKLYSFVDDWAGAPYQYGGKSKSGIDCSGFVSALYKNVYGKEFSGSAESMCRQCRKISSAALQQGDLVFFNIDSNGISHVGIYLQNNKFVHATVKGGVMINDLNETYYRKTFESAGRMK
ncbi:MAG: C40 family peptidase [Bacteroidetes bacterium]|nr:C40 family peptidase [Bacteroidota bacterium]